MQEVMAKINELHGLLQRKIAENEALLAANNRGAAEISEKAKYLAEVEASLALRELKVLPSEEILRRQEETNATEKKVMDESNDLAARKEAFRILGNQQLMELQNKQNDITHREAMLEKGWIDLNKEKVEYKEKIIAELQKHMGLDAAIKNVG